MIPDLGGPLETLEPTLAELERRGVPYLIDPVLEPIGFGFMASLERYADCARAMGVADGGEGSQATVARLLDELRRLNVDLQVPTPRAWGIDARRYEELLPVMASQALASGSPANNPRVPSSDEIIDLYRRAYG